MINKDIKKVIVLGSGALKIGEAGEFGLFRISGSESAEGRECGDHPDQPEYCDHSDFGRHCRPDLFPPSDSIFCGAGHY